MLVIMKSHATDEEVTAVCRKIEAMGYKAHPIPGITRTAIGITGNQGPVEATALESLPGVGECVPYPNRTSSSAGNSKRKQQSSIWAMEHG